MNPTTEPSSTEPANTPKKPYQAPQLRDYGPLANLTQTGNTGNEFFVDSDGPIYITSGITY